MLRSTVFLALFGFIVALNAEESLDKVPEVAKCYSVCSGNTESACKKGCKFAYALTFAPKDYAHNPSCEDSCKDKYSDASENSACAAGCANFEGDEVTRVTIIGEPQTLLSNMIHRAEQMAEFAKNIFNGKATSQEETDSNEQPGDEQNPINRKISEMMQRMRNMMSSGSTSNEESDDEPLTTRIRILFFAKPQEESEDLPNVLTVNHGDHSEMIARPAILAGRKPSLCHRMFSGVKRMFSDPFHILLVMSIIALVALFITQVALCMRRRSRRSNINEFTRLPTYAEAMDIKVPIGADDDLFVKPTKESGKPPADENPHA